MPTPQVAFADLDWCAGCYAARGKRYDAAYWGVESTGARDLIVISTRWELRPATLAHEFRHMQQHYLPSLPAIYDAPALDFGKTPDSWADAIRVFYRRPYEADALRYERRLSPDETNEQHWRAAVSP